MNQFSIRAPYIKRILKQFRPLTLWRHLAGAYCPKNLATRQLTVPAVYLVQDYQQPYLFLISIHIIIIFYLSGRLSLVPIITHCQNLEWSAWIIERTQIEKSKNKQQRLESAGVCGLDAGRTVDKNHKGRIPTPARLYTLHWTWLH